MRNKRQHNGQLSLYLNGGPRSRILPPADHGPFSELYFAVLPDEESAARSHELAGNFHRQYRSFAKPRRADLLHVTLYAIGSFRNLPEETAFAAMEAASRVRKPSCPVVFDEVVSFGNGDNRPLVLWNRNGNAELKAIYRELVDAMRLTGIAPPKERPVEPHMTLLYRGQSVPDIRLEKPVSWTARDFVLINSLQGEATHEHLGYWILRD
ncbi:MULTISPECIES: 2'-5' RNA ligase family protein [unclassified Rhizobium]|jgi:2'-5' RNA ligase|uniref:2'-5' RNA ligase family protein n=1 Tax=unclassified Rhizobium TaxID=2613769 RepID=UPI0006459B16|nr:MULTISPECIES: 2'-5' RNA ligase family protein [unclassified Rhizobium]MBN8949748.1 2'-5' RNA ligase family protein [Rhizobium tropici]OJY62852.1 MAG: 2'-5' RNA ligase [Rhizobium sp. 60-20]RKD74916.1 2'-5' RNA ligase [Rhizobium sp. WW_1]